MNRFERLKQEGFTLVELAVVMFVVALMLAGALIPLTTQMEVRSIAETRRIMDQINEALIGFAQTNGRLPCPAIGTVASGTGTAGTEQTHVANVCPSLIGVVPWATLGVPETDAWGRRFTYRVASVFADANAAATWHTTAPATQSGSATCNPPTPVPSSPTSFALCTLGEIAVRTRNVDAASARGTAYLGTGLSAVFISHGRNGYGGFQTTGVLVNAINANPDEVVNTSAGAAQLTPGTGVNPVASWVFYSRPHTTLSTGCSDADAAAAGTAFCEFDDLTYMVPSATLASRMISAGRLL